MHENDPAQSLSPELRKISAGEKPTRYRYRVLAVGCGLSLLAYVHRQSFNNAGVTKVAQALALNDAQVGYFGSAFLIAYGLFQVPCGVIGDRLGARHLLAFLIFGWSLLTGMTALADVMPAIGVEPFVYLLCVRFLFGGLQSGFFPAWSRVMADWMPSSERATAQGMVWMFSRLGGAAAPLLFFWLVRLFHNWTTPFWVLAVVGFVACFLFWFWFRNRPDEVAQVDAAERELIAAGRETSGQRVPPVPWLVLLRSANVWALCLMYGFVGFAGNFNTNLLAIYLNNDRGLSDQTTAWLSGLPLAVGIVSCVLGGVFSDWISRRTGSRKWGRRINGLIGLNLAGVALAAVPWVQPVWLLAFLFGAAGFCNDLIMGPAWASCVDVGERYAGTISGAMNTIGQFFGAVGLALAGILLHHGQSEVLFFLFGGSYALAALCWLAVDVTKPLRVEPPNGPSGRSSG